MSVPNTRVCTAAGTIGAGAICAETLTEATSEMTLQEYLDFLEPRIDPPRAGAMCMSAEDWNKQKTALEKACRRLGGACSYETRLAIRVMDRLAERSRLRVK